MGNSSVCKLALLVTLIFVIFLEVKSEKENKLVIKNAETDFKNTLQALQLFWFTQKNCAKLETSKKLFKEAGEIAAHMAQKEGLLEGWVLPKLSATSMDIWKYAGKINQTQAVSTKDFAASAVIQGLLEFAICRQIKAEVGVGCFQAEGIWFIVFLFKGKWAKTVNMLIQPRNGSILGQLSKLDEYSKLLLEEKLNGYKKESYLVYYAGQLRNVCKTTYIVLWSMEDLGGILEPSGMLNYLDTSLKAFIQKWNDNAKQVYVDVVLVTPNETGTSIYGDAAKKCVVCYFE